MSERQHAYETVAAYLKDLEAACDIGAESLSGGPTYYPQDQEEIWKWEEVLRQLEPHTAEEPFYTMLDAATFKGVSYHTVSRAVRRGTLPAQRMGRMALIARADLDAWRPMVERRPSEFKRNPPKCDVTVAPLIVGEVRG